jgi:signal transduction histidine kinase/ligand-binding sensor domain-containing protein/CheY-like chemotaxis protein/AraC-like DNA-binding protein
MDPEIRNTMRHINAFVTLCFCLAAIGGTAGYAQESRLFTTENGLSSSLINRIYQDTYGVVWMATEDGLNRYDAAKFTVFRRSPDDPHSIASNYVRVLYEDRSGRFFIGGLRGLQRYDRATERFYTIPIFNQNRELIETVNVSNIIERRGGDSYVFTSGNGVFALETANDSVVMRLLPDFLPGVRVSAVCEDSEGYLWIGTTNNGIYRIADDYREWKQYMDEADPKWRFFSSLIKDGGGNLYAGSLSGGLFRYDRAADRFVSIAYHARQNLSIKSLHAAADDRLLIGTDGNGMKVYDMRQRRIADRQLDIHQFNPQKAKIHSILEDRFGNLWFGLFQKGVLLTPPSERNFHYTGYKSVTHDIIGSSCVMSVCRDHTGTLWVGTDNDGLYGINPDGTLRVHYTPAADDAHAVPATIMSIFEDSRHNLWLGSYLGGVARFDPRSGRCEYLPLTDERQNSVKTVYCFAEDKRGDLWMGTGGNGLFRLNPQTNAFTGFLSQRTPAGVDWLGMNCLHNDYINCLLYDEGSDRLYIGSFDGIGCLDIGTLDFVTPLGARRILRNVVYALYLDPRGNLWAGAADGLQHIELPSQTTRLYTRAEGLPSDQICAIESDGKGMLWISTGHGITHFDPRDKHFTNYYATDGLYGNEFSRNASCTGRPGELIFGGMNGVISFRPEEIRAANRSLDIRVTDFYLHNKAVHKGSRSGGREIINTTVTDADYFRLSHRDNSFSIELSAMEFYSPEYVTFLYSVNGNKWVDLQSGVNRLSFGDLQPGTYHFRFQAKEHATYSDIKAITVFIAPPWYASVWAKMIYTLLILAVSVIILLQVRHRIRVRQELLEHQHAEQINEAKLQFFTDIAHEIRTPMSLIISPLQTLMNTDHDGVRSTIYHTIYRNAERILQLVNQLMDMRKIDRGQMQLHFYETMLVPFMLDLYATFLAQTEAKQIRMHFVQDETTGQQVTAWIDPDNFDKVIVNVLANAIKFTPTGGEITLSLRTGHDPEAPTAALQHYVEIVIADNGIGIPPEEAERIFERFYQIRDHTFRSGTGIGLHLCRSLMTLHHGTIRAAAHDDGKPGTRFIIRLPQGKEHLTAGEIGMDTAAGPPPSALSFLHREPSADLPDPALPYADEKSNARRRQHLLIVEDDAEVKEYLWGELKSDYYIRLCSNGKEALKEVLKQMPDLIVSDIMMPEMDGLTLCRKIKQNININHIPIILLTARNREEDNLEGLSTGADAYIAKPFSIEIIRKTIENLISGRSLLRSSFSGNQMQENRLELREVASPDEQLMERIMKYLNANIGSPNLSVDFMAQEVGLSRVHLYRKLKEITNQAPRDFIRNVRLKQAAMLLSEKRYNISEISYMVGFSSPIYFTTVFREHYGMSPKEWMEKG